MAASGENGGAVRRGAVLGAAIFAAIALAGCASRPGPEVLTPVAAAPDAKLLTIYVATTRGRDTQSNFVFTTARASALNFEKFTIAVPPGHRPGEIEWPRGAPDPRTSFATVDHVPLPDAAFRDAVAPTGKAVRGAEKRKVLIFVHGYNNNFQESLFRLAQIGADSGVQGTAILFAWPSRGTLTGYGADRESVTYSRDDLVTLITMVAASPQVGEITLLAHSMGSLLTVEALRQLRIAHQDKVIARLSRVVLAAPDIDVDVFRSQMRTIGRLKPPLVVLVSKDDRALRASSLIAGQSRIGALDVDNPAVQEAALNENIQIVDISQLTAADSMHHGRFVGLAAMYPRLQQENAAVQGQAGTFSLDAVGEAIAKPFRAAGSAAEAEAPAN